MFDRRFLAIEKTGAIVVCNREKTTGCKSFIFGQVRGAGLVYGGCCGSMLGAKSTHSYYLGK